MKEVTKTEIKTRILFNLRGQKETDSANGGGKDEI